MRTLNRPMFNMGGPIKEGVMHGIREPYAGGQLVRPGPGRPGYQGEGFWQKFLANYTPKNLTPKKLFSRLNPFSSKKIKALKHIKPAAQNLQGIFVRKATSPGITSSGAGSAWAAGPSKYLNYLKKAGPMAKNIWDKHRYKTIAGGIGLTSDPARETYKWIGEKAPGIIKHVTPGWLERMISGEGKETGTATNVPLNPNLQATIKVAKELSKKKTKDFALQQREDRVQKYLKMMGYDRSKKLAIADALIDASKIVGERGTLDPKNITQELINPIIQATSKRLDKPEQIREAVGLMSVKAAIEKDLEDPSIKALRLEQLRGLKGSFESDLGDFILSAKGGKVKKEALEQFARVKAKEHGETFTVVDEGTTIPEGGSGYYMIEDKIFRVVDGTPQQVV